MGKRSFTASERYAVYTVHGERCYLCSKPIDLMTMQVDHIIPESLLKDPDRLSQVLFEYGLSEDFDLQSYSNWLPACGPCNNTKRNEVFDPTPIIQRFLQKAVNKADEAKKMASSWVNDKKSSKAWNTIQRSFESGTLNEEIIKEILAFVAFHSKKREPEATSDQGQLTPTLNIWYAHFRYDSERIYDQPRLPALKRFTKFVETGQAEDGKWYVLRNDPETDDLAIIYFMDPN